METQKQLPAAARLLLNITVWYTVASCKSLVAIKQWIENL